MYNSLSKGGTHFLKSVKWKAVEDTEVETSTEMKPFSFSYALESSVLFAFKIHADAASIHRYSLPKMQALFSWQEEHRILVILPDAI